MSDLHNWKSNLGIFNILGLNYWQNLSFREKMIIFVNSRPSKQLWPVMIIGPNDLEIIFFAKSRLEQVYIN